MKKNFFSLLLMLLIVMPHSASSSPSAAANEPLETAAIRAEFDELFGEVQIYKVIRKHLPEAYENFFQSYLAAKRTDSKEIGIAGFVNSIRNAYLKQACDESILGFFRYTIDTGRELFTKDPDAAFSYFFGGDPVAYEKYLDFALEQKKLGQLLEQMLSTRAAENSQKIDRAQVDSGLDYVYVLLYYKYGENFSLLTRDSRDMTTDERHQLCAIYLDMYEEILNLVPTTRNSVLRSMALNM
jgi:hypothetical protein